MSRNDSPTLPAMPAEIDGPAPGRWLLRDQMLRSPTFAQALTKSSCFGAWQEWLRPCQIGRKPFAPADSVPSQAGSDMYGTNVEQIFPHVEGSQELQSIAHAFRDRRRDVLNAVK